MDKGIYERNLGLLKSLDAAAARKVEEAPDFSSCELIRSKIGLPTLRVSQNGTSVLLHSSYNPLEEAQRIVSEYRIKESDYLIVLGFGLGYHIRECLKSSPQTKIWVIEPQISLFKKIISLIDITSLLPRIRLILEDDFLAIERRLKRSSQIMLTGKILLLPHFPSLQLFPEYGQIRKAVLDIIHWARLNLNTNIRVGVSFQKNILANIPEIMKNPGIEHLFGQFKDKPAICVAAGPSLDKNIEVLSQGKNKALIICVDAALQTLLQHGIKPDIVTCIDPGQVTLKFFEESRAEMRDIFLASDPEVCPETLANFSGRKFIISINKPAMVWLLPFLSNRYFLPKGLTVAHTSFFVAEVAGCNPIVLVGQDLSYPTGMSHTQGTTGKTEINIGTDRKTQQKYLLKMDRKKRKWNAEPLRMVEGIYGKKVPTDNALYSYLTYFQEIIARAKAICIDATEGGARIKGTKILALEEAINKYCQKPIAVREILEKAYQQDEPYPESLKEHIKKAVIKLKEIDFWASQGKMVLEKLDKEIKKRNPCQQEKERLMRESNRIKDRLLSASVFLRRMIEANMYGNVCLIFKKTSLESHLVSERKKLVNRMEKVSLYYTGMAKACQELGQDLEETLNKI